MTDVCEDAIPISTIGRWVEIQPTNVRRKIVNGGKGIYVGGTLLSMLISLALYATGRRETAIFVGLWALSILNLGQSHLEEE